MYETFIQDSAIAYGIPEAWIRAIIETESSWDPDAFRSEPSIGDASYGLMQLLTRTAAGLGFRGAPADLYDPETNIDLGTRLLAQLKARFGDDFKRIYSAYISGKPDTWETDDYVSNRVAVALNNLAKWATPTAEAGGGLLLLILAGLWWFWPAFIRSTRGKRG